MSDNNQSPIIVALDFDDENLALSLVEQLDSSLCRLKIGKELFTRCGPQLVSRVQQKGFDVFLDLKFHDIPHTVAQAVDAAADLGVWMVNVHASGGRRMMESAANKLAQKNSSKTLLTAVTVLTSMDDSDFEELGYPFSVEQQVFRLAKLAKDCGLDGVVCSSRETRELKSRLGKDFILVTPGIRPQGSEAGDQKRIMTPVQALQSGSDYLVIGRPITKSPQPFASLEAIYADIKEVAKLA